MIVMNNSILKSFRLLSVSLKVIMRFKVLGGQIYTVGAQRYFFVCSFVMLHRTVTLHVKNIAKSTFVLKICLISKEHIFIVVCIKTCVSNALTNI